MVQSESLKGLEKTKIKLNFKYLKIDYIYI